MSKHTPGPWRMNEEIGADESNGVAPYLAFHSIRDENDEFIASTWGGPNEANARLIAAAPDMLEALEIIMANPNSFNWEIVRAAIAKATGATNERLQHSY